MKREKKHGTGAVRRRSLSPPPVATVYLAGPMRGHERFNFDAFDAAQRDLEGRGYQVLSPAALDREVGFDPSVDTLEDFDLAAAVRRDVDAITHSSQIVLLPGWRASRGARAEKAVGEWMGIPAVEYPDMTPVETEVQNSKFEIRNSNAAAVTVETENRNSKIEVPSSDIVAATVSERGKVYGPPGPSHQNIGLSWTGLIQQHYGLKLDHPLPDFLVDLMMVVFKAQRAARVFKEDNYVDLRAYTNFAEEDQRARSASSDPPAR